MAHKKPSVPKEAEIDYQAKKNVKDKLSSTYKKSRKKLDKLREELKATIPGREHGAFGRPLEHRTDCRRLRSRICRFQVNWL